MEESLSIATLIAALFAMSSFLLLVGLEDLGAGFLTGNEDVFFVASILLAMWTCIVIIASDWLRYLEQGQEWIVRVYISACLLYASPLFLGLFVSMLALFILVLVLLFLLSALRGAAGNVMRSAGRK